MSVAIVIVNFNSGALLARCLKHLASQTLAPDETIVVDNDSQDEESIRLLDTLSNVTIIRAGKNLGFAAAANLGAAAASHEYVCFLNPDAFVSETWLEELIAAAEQHPECGSFASMLLMSDDHTLVDGAGDKLHFSGLPWRTHHGKPRASLVVEEETFSACAGAALYRMSAFNEVGGFDESFFMYVEDVDLGFRLQLAGYHCMLVQDAIAHHIGSAISGKRSDQSVYFGHRNLVWCYFKNMPLLLLILTLPLHLLMTLATFVVFGVEGRIGVIGRSKAAALAGLCHAVAKRRQVLRRVSTGYVWSILAKSLVR